MTLMAPGSRLPDVAPGDMDRLALVTSLSLALACRPCTPRLVLRPSGHVQLDRLRRVTLYQSQQSHTAFTALNEMPPALAPSSASAPSCCRSTHAITPSSKLGMTRRPQPSQAGRELGVNPLLGVSIDGRAKAGMESARRAGRSRRVVTQPPIARAALRLDLIWFGLAAACRGRRGEVCDEELGVAVVGAGRGPASAAPLLAPGGRKGGAVFWSLSSNRRQEGGGRRQAGRAGRRGTQCRGLQARRLRAAQSMQIARNGKNERWTYTGSSGGSPTQKENSMWGDACRSSQEGI
jgi:hypothetical protein